MEGFFDSICIEFADSGASVAMIYPGWVSKSISSRVGCWICLAMVRPLAPQLKAVTRKN
jgi:hypothetical protein